MDTVFDEESRFYYAEWQLGLQEQFMDPDTTLQRTIGGAAQLGVPTPIIAAPTMILATAAFTPSKKLEGTWLFQSKLLTTEKQRKKHYWRSMRAVLP